MHGILNLSGIALLFGVMYLFSTKRENIKFKLIGRALILQFIIAFILVKFSYGRMLIQTVANWVMLLLGYGQSGLEFVFGSLASPTGAAGYVFIVQALGNVIFIAALIGGLYYLGVIGFIVEKLGRLMGKCVGASEVESIVAVANMFLGQTDSPFLVSKYIKRMTNSELTVVMASGMSGMSVTILGGYTALGIPMEYLLIACAMVPLGSIMIAKVLLPEDPELTDKITNIKIDRKGNNKNVIEAITNGALDGVQVVIAIAASLVAIIAMVALINGLLSNVGLTLELILSYLFAPIGFFMGIDAANIFLAGQLLGTKLTLNEFVAFGQLGKILAELDYRTGLILSLAIAGFANFSSLGINISILSVLCPEKKSLVAQLVPRAMVGGFTVSVINAMIVGFILSF